MLLCTENRQMPKIELTVAKKDMFLFEELSQNVDVKNRMGFRTTLGFEVSRLLRKAMCHDEDEYLRKARLLDEVKDTEGVEDEHRQVPAAGVS